MDAIYIAVPNLQHARYARVALEAGKHVIVEKPMAVTAAEDRRSWLRWHSASGVPV